MLTEYLGSLSFVYQHCMLQCNKERCRNLSISNPEQFQWCNEESSENGNYRNDNKGLCTIAWGCIVGHYHKDVMCLYCRVFVREQAKEIITISR